MAKWKEFELLSHKILKEVSPNADVKLDDKIYGTLSGIKRQIDVSIRTVQILTIVQAKDYTTPADVNIVGEFSSVIQDVKATKGILICKSGFTVAASNYAKNLGILLLKIHDAQSRDWNLDNSIPIIWKETELTNIRIKGLLRPNVEFNGQVNDNGNLDFYDSKSENRFDILNDFRIRWNKAEFKGINNFVIDYDNNLSIKGWDKNGKTIYLTVENFKITFNVKLGKCLLGYFKSEYVRGYLDLHEDAFFVSNKNEVIDLPKKPLENWNEIDLEKTPLNIRGTFVEATNSQTIEKISFHNFGITEV